RGSMAASTLASGAHTRSPALIALSGRNAIRTQWITTAFEGGVGKTGRSAIITGLPEKPGRSVRQTRTYPPTQDRAMPKPPFVEFAPDEELQEMLRECTENFDVGNPDEEWPHNILSTKLVVFGSGRIARSGDPIEHRVDPDELDLIRR